MTYAITEAPNETDLPKCKEIAMILSDTYPGHNWWVDITDGLIRMRSLKISANSGMVVPLRRFDGDSERLKREIVMKGGEFLEAAGLRRGAFLGENATTLKGMPKNQENKVKLMLDEPTTTISDIIVDV